MSEAVNSASGAEIQKLLQQLGIACSYIDYGGNSVSIENSNRRAIAELMGANFESAGAIRDSIRRFNACAGEVFLPRTVVLKHGQQQALGLSLSEDQLDSQLQWSVKSETGTVQKGSLCPRKLAEEGRASAPGALQWSLPELEVGYYQLTLRVAGQSGESFLIVAPAHCFEPEWVAEQRSLAGLNVQLYGLASSSNWGMGDFGDLRELIRHCVANSLDFIVLNPLHALDPARPEHCSPYSPLDRRFLNPLYLALESEPDFLESEQARRYVRQKKVQKSLEKLRKAELVDYVAVAAHKLAVLDAMYAQFQSQHLAIDSERARVFRRWVAEHETLKGFAEFEAARNRGNQDHTADPQFHMYLQWLSTCQFEACQRHARDSGMAVGLIRDLAVGGNAASAEVQLNENLFCSGASIGAPPDSFAPQGQNWGLPPMNPVTLIASRFRHFIELLSSNMQHCGALRIDHVMALMRLWWCPGTDHSGKGAYVHYPVDALFAILRVESQRQRCMVIGEDLGVVPPEIRRYMADSRVFGNAVFYFEKYDSVYFRKPKHFPPNALAMISNHDVPTLSAWWNKSDLDLRQELGLYDDDQQLNDAIHARESDLIQVLHWLDNQSLLPAIWQDFNIHREFDRALCRAIVEGNGRSASRLVSLQPEDICLAQLPVNIPGTSTEYPNWRRKLPLDLEELFTRPESIDLLAAFVKARAA